MEKLEVLNDIIRNSNMSTRPEYYSGRGVNQGGPSVDIMLKIHDGIE